MRRDVRSVTYALGFPQATLVENRAGLEDLLKTLRERRSALFPAEIGSAVPLTKTPCVGPQPGPGAQNSADLPEPRDDTVGSTEAESCDAAAPIASPGNAVCQPDVEGDGGSRAGSPRPMRA